MDSVNEIQRELEEMQLVVVKHNKNPLVKKAMDAGYIVTDGKRLGFKENKHSILYVGMKPGAVPSRNQRQQLTEELFEEKPSSAEKMMPATPKHTQYKEVIDSLNERLDELLYEYRNYHMMFEEINERGGNIKLGIGEYCRILNHLEKLKQIARIN